MDKKGVINYGGVVHDVRTVIKSANVLVLPTFYREGFRGVYKKLCHGRPVITTDFMDVLKLLRWDQFLLCLQKMSHR